MEEYITITSSNLFPGCFINDYINNKCLNIEDGLEVKIITKVPPHIVRIRKEQRRLIYTYSSDNVYNELEKYYIKIVNGRIIFYSSDFDSSIILTYVGGEVSIELYGNFFEVSLSGNIAILDTSRVDQIVKLKITSNYQVRELVHTRGVGVLILTDLIRLCTVRMENVLQSSELLINECSSLRRIIGNRKFEKLMINGELNNRLLVSVKSINNLVVNLDEGMLDIYSKKINDLIINSVNGKVVLHCEFETLICHMIGNVYPESLFGRSIYKYPIKLDIIHNDFSMSDLPLFLNKEIEIFYCLSLEEAYYKILYNYDRKKLEYSKKICINPLLMDLVLKYI